MSKSKKKTDKKKVEPERTERDELDDVLAVDPVMIKSELSRMPGYFAGYGEIAAEAARARLHAKHEVKRVHASLYCDLKEQADGGDGKRAKLTEGHIAAMIETDDEYREAVNNLVSAEYNYKAANVAYAAVQAKMESLMAITGHVRDERRAQGVGGYDSSIDDDDDADA